MKTLFTLFSALLLFSCASLPENKEQSTDLSFGRYLLHIPSGVISMSNLMGTPEGLVFIYEYDNSDRKPSLYNKFLIVSYVAQDELVPEYKEGCNYALFIDDLYRGTEESGCGKEALRDYYAELLEGYDYGIWKSGDPNIYYVVDERGVDVVITSTDRPNLRIESNFLNKEQMKAIVSKYIND